MATVTPTYSPNNEYERKAATYRSQVGDNPEAIRQAAAKEMTAGNQELQGAIQGQQGSVSAMQQLADFDKTLASQISQNNQAQQAKDTARFGATTAMGQINPNNAQATIASGPATFDLATFAQNYGPTQGAMMGPGASSAISSGQQQAAQGTFDLASQQRGSLERAIGSEAEAISRIAGAQIERERIEAELARMESERKAEEQQRQFEMDLKYAEAYGGTVTDPVSGKTYSFKSEADRETEKLNREKAAEQTVLQRRGQSGKTLLEEVVDGLGSFTDVITENPDLSDDEIVALAKANVRKFGPFRESNDDLRKMGLGMIVDNGLNMESAGTSPLASDDDVLAKAYSLPGAAEIIGQGKDAATRSAIAKQLISSGSVDAYKEKMGMNTAAQRTPEELQKRAELKRLADEILSSGTKGLTGNVRLGLLNPFSQDLKTKRGKIERLKSMLQLEAARAMKGQGTMSDAERAILANSVASLDYGQEDDAFRTEIQRISDMYTDMPQTADAGAGADPLGLGI